MLQKGHGVVMGDNVGKYQLIAQIGEVYPHRVSVGTCRGPANGTQLVLVRCPLPGVLGSENERLRLLTTARMLTRAKHPNLAAIYDVEDDAYNLSFVGEYLEGQHFSAVLDAARTVRNAFPHTVLLRMVADVLAGLSYLHELPGSAAEPLGVVHGGIHPRNLVITYDGTTKIVGLESVGARLELRPDASVDASAAFYAAPEQLDGRAVDARADLFAVGELIWEIVARQPLLRGSREVVRRKLEAGPLPSISSVVRGVPEVLQAVLDRALRINPDERYASAGEMLGDVERYLASTGKTISPEHIAERMLAVFAQEAEHAKHCATVWLGGAAAGNGVDGASAGTVGPGGWLGASLVSPPSLSSSPAASFATPVSPAAIPYADVDSPSPVTRSLMIASSLHDVDDGMPRRRPRLMLGVAIGAVMAFVAVGAMLASGLLLRWFVSPEKAAPAAAVTAPVAPAALGSAPASGTAASPRAEGTLPPVATSATVRLDSEPGNATVEWQGQVVGRTPIQLTVPLGLQTFAVSQEGYKRQDVVMDTSVAAGPEGLSTKVLLVAEDQAPPPLVSTTKPPKGNPRAARAAASPRPSTGTSAIRASATSSSSVASPSASPAPSPAVAAPPVQPETPSRPAAKPAPKIRTIDVKSPTIKTIDDDTQSDGSKVKVISDD